MAAPCGRMLSRCVFQVLSAYRRSGISKVGCRYLSMSPVSRINSLKGEVQGSPWTLMAAVCLQRLPVISAEPSPIEQQFKHLLQQIELEKSVLADHELRLLEDAERMRRKQANDYDSDEEEGRGGQEIIMTQDLEDVWDQKLKEFQPEPRVRDDIDKDVTSAERCLQDKLILLAEQQVGGEKLWLLPQTQWKEGETLRQTAERALASLPATDLKATFLGNAPCGVYKFKLAKAARTQSSEGVKVFFFKAILSDPAPPKTHTASFVWLKKTELESYLKPKYLQKVNRFILSL
ncbi:large ribosomal subunit protein mL46 [Gouania willdenowi]|uniref:Large ribosomal subunit protein mL46 n=1 Tax=Gouania willdenowi TaxID=441366 RepID=A0A8C5D6I1_GOUWI|nr:39S ribosomal protein L46, mitochondrial [Gouania willdenowi]